MGIFDIFTGAAAKKAAAKNKKVLNDNYATGLGYIDTGEAKAVDALNASGGSLNALAQKYGAGTNLYLDALGVNGAEAAANARNSFTNSPGYQYQQDEAAKQLLRQSSAAGMLNSGNTLTALQDRAQGIASQDYNNWLTNLSGLVNPELSATTGAAGVGTSLAGLYSGNASQRVGLGNFTTTGVTGQNTQAANAEMQGSANLWNLGQNLLKLGVGAYGSYGGARA